MADERWRVTASSYPIDARFLRLRKDSVELPNGHRIDDYYVKESRGFSVIFALTAERDVVLVRQYKHGIGKTLLELPAGALDPGESPAACASRELEEETGYSGAIEYVRTFVIDPTNADTVAHLFFAPAAHRSGDQRLDASENIEVELVPLARIRDFVRNGAIDSVAHVAGIYAILDRLNLI